MPRPPRVQYENAFYHVMKEGVVEDGYSTERHITRLFLEHWKKHMIAMMREFMATA